MTDKMKIQALSHITKECDASNSYNTAALLCLAMGTTPHLQEKEPTVIPYDENYMSYLWNLRKNHTWLPSDVDEEKAYKYLIKQNDDWDENENIEYVQRQKEKGITATDLFMMETSDINIALDATEREVMLFQAHREAMQKEESVFIPKPSKGKKKRARAKRKRINKAKHLLGNLQVEASQATFTSLEGIQATPGQEKLIKSYLRYHNAIFGKYITKEVLNKYVEGTMMFVEEYDFSTPQIAKDGLGQRYGRYSQFIINLLKGRLDHLHIQPGEDLHNYLNGNGRFEEPRQPMSKKMQENIQRFKDVIKKPA